MRISYDKREMLYLLFRKPVVESLLESIRIEAWTGFMLRMSESQRTMLLHMAFTVKQVDKINEIVGK